MPMLTINNLTVPVLNATPRKSYLEIGSEVDRTARGASMAVGRRAIKRSWDMVARYADGQSAEALESWVTGLGVWHVGFDDGVSSDNGLCPDRGYIGRVTTSSLFGGAGRCWRTVNNTDQIRYRFPWRTRNTDWTVMAWFALAPAGPFTHLAVVSRGGVVTRYANAVITATIANIAVDLPTVNALRATLNSQTQAGVPTAAVCWDDLVVANWPMTSAMISAVFSSGRAFSPAPAVEANGDFLREPGPVLVQGVMAPTDYLQGRDVGASGWQNNARTFAFRLEEV